MQVVLVVDDDETILVVMARTLAEEGYAVHSAASAKDAVRLAEALHGRLRLVITDIRMPDMSGIELADLATQRHGGLKIILISGYYVSQQVERRFLRKPFRMRDLEDAVRAELDI